MQKVEEKFADIERKRVILKTTFKIPQKYIKSNA